MATRSQPQQTADHENSQVDQRGELKKQFFIGSIDQGTTSTRFLIFDGTGNPVAQHQIEFQQIFPQSGWMEHDPVEIVESVHTCIEEAVKSFTEQGHSVSDIKAIGITTQRETTVLWDSQTGELAHNAIAWPDTRTQSLVRELKQKTGADKLQEICGLPLSTYPSSLKLTWMLRNLPKVQQLYAAGRLAFGTIDTWLLYNLNGKTQRNVHVTDVTNASRTMFVNLHTLEYDSTLLDFFAIDPTKLHLPKIVPCSDPDAFGSLTSGPLRGVKITGCLGDQSAALVGQQGFSPGQAKNTYGTGCFLLYNVGHEPVISKHGLLATVAYQFGSPHHKPNQPHNHHTGNQHTNDLTRPTFALEGSIAVAGSAIKFLQHNFHFIPSSAAINDLALTVPDSGGCVFVTAFSGLFAPYWIDDARGTIWGLTQFTQRGHVARAVLEATCFQTRAILRAMEKDSAERGRLEVLKVDGGMSNSELCMQTQANILQIPISRPSMRETTSLGAAIAAGFGIGIYHSFDELTQIINAKEDDRTVFQPLIGEAESEKLFRRWERAVRMSEGWLEEGEEEGGKEASS